MKAIAAREGGLRFEVFLPSTLADWLLDLIERGVFFDPSEAVFVLLGEAKDLVPYQDLRDEQRPGIPAAEVTARMREEMARPYPVPATWRMDKEP
ncbi:putative transcriptional regulator CopG/Arc/MetJ family (plasmid) [Gluconacetobacter diazotrophicus PA1 5]|uniref:hypothetical protein n=1 Tax=Gluconacetobacter diazotrophicus TaxID=33996 RepID=UPI000173CFA1|nr:hypothetical protein [Gluconacetobacter diazotrophicus]ACI53278.1 putative transcriptional regulator CopG/Arc/MetJ family [Gluconacetobacter diazotrophicus PA1 5]TWB00360.1 hypothetical protein FBZ86_1385 [Gluconacetobacter diazotrophicus]